MDDLERAVLDAEKLDPAADLRARVLDAAMPLLRADASRLDQVWFSAKWRMAAAVALLVIAGAELLSPRVPSWAPLADDHRVMGAVRVVSSAARQVGLTEQETALIVAQAIEAQRPRE